MRAALLKVMLAVGLCAGLAASAPAAASSGAEAVASTVPTLTAVRAARHAGYDRLVFQFAGSLPARHALSWVPRVIEDASGRPMAVRGRAFVRVVFSPARAHGVTGAPTYTRRLPGLADFPVLAAVVPAGDFENVVSFGVGLWQRTALHVFVLAAPPRLVIDASVPAAAPQRLGSIDAGRLVSLRVGQQSTIALRTCVPCGNSWRIAGAPRAAVLRVVSSSVVALPHAPGTVGFPSETRWLVRATGAGTTTLVLEEMPPGSGGAPIQRYLLRFAVSA